MSAVQPSILRISDLDPYLTGNATVSSLQDNVAFMEKLVFGLIVADVVLFVFLCLAVCALCKSCDRTCKWYARDRVPYASVDINVPQKVAVGAAGRCGLQA